MQNSLHPKGVLWLEAKVIKSLENETYVNFSNVMVMGLLIGKAGAREINTRGARSIEE